MTPRQSRPLVIAAVMLIFVVGIFSLGGYLLHSLVASSFVQIERVQSAQHLNSQTLNAQLDLETGVRGYINTGDRSLLIPYYNALPHIHSDFLALRKALPMAGMPEYEKYAEDAQESAETWQKLTVQFVNSSDPRALLAKLSIGGFKRSKILVTRFRADVDLIDDALSQKRLMTAEDARASVDRIAIFVSFVVFSIAILGYIFVVTQYRLAGRLELARRTSEDERQRLATMRIALETEKRIGDKLQDALSQRPLPTLPAVHFSAMYMPATEESKVGGDWYDAIELSPSRALFVIGDVAGHGLDAAVGMSRARQEFIGSALRKSDPAEILERVNIELVRENSPMVTGVCGLADSLRYEFSFATAGHPPPVLLEPGREPRLLACGGLPLGVVATAEYKTYTIQSVPGAILVLYTDGAIEHSHSVLEGEQLLLEATAALRDQNELDPATAIHRRIFAGRLAGDDVAILTIGFAAADPAGMRISVERSHTSFASEIRVTPPVALEAELPPRLGWEI